MNNTKRWAITKLFEGEMVRRNNWPKNNYIFMYHDGSIRNQSMCQGNLNIFKTHSDHNGWELFNKNSPDSENSRYP